MEISEIYHICMNTSDGARHHIYMLMQEEAAGVEGVGRSEKTAAQPAAAPTPKHLDVDCTGVMRDGS